MPVSTPIQESHSDIDLRASIASLSWVKDGTTEEERYAIDTIYRILEEYPEFGKAVLDLWWVRDDMPTVQRFALSDLLYLARANLALARQVIEQPFMEPPFRFRDQYALSALLSLAEGGLHDDERHALWTQLNSQTWFSNGLDDLDAALLYAISSSSDDFRQALIEEKYVASAAVELPLSGIVDTVVVRHTPFPPDDHTFVTMEEGLRNIENFMGMPFPVNDIILILTDRNIWVVGGKHYSFRLGDKDKPYTHMIAHMVIDDSEFGPLKRTVYHEIGHYYYLQGHSWLREGVANLLEAYTRDQIGVESIENRLAYYEALRGPDDIGTVQDENETIFRDIYELSQCESHGLGEQFMLGIYTALGPEALSRALRELHSLSQRFVKLNDDTIYSALLAQTTDENREAFKTAYRRYHGGHVVDSVPEDSPDWPPLAALYESANGADWIQNQNWVAPGVPLGAWHGVDTDTSSRVWQLDLESNSLAGELPSELGGLSSLTRLKLAHNSLDGEIPSEFGMLSNLITLDLRDNQLDGAIPPELGNLRHLESLAMWGNQLNGEIPSELGMLSSLTWLDLDQNSLMGEIPPELGNLPNISYMSLNENRLSGEIPSELERLPSLTSLLLGYNQLTGDIPSELANLENLSGLTLSGNQLSGEIPIELGRLANLSDLRLNDNLLTGEIPMELGALSNLTALDLAWNRLTGQIPVELGFLSNLRVLALTGNNLTGEIPPELENLTELRTLFLWGNQFTGCIPDGLRDVPENDLSELGLAFCGTP